MKKLTTKQMQTKLWKLCREIALQKYSINGNVYCFTCDRYIEGSNRQLGHFIPRSTCGAFLKYNLDNLRWQCFRCNINLGGNGAEFYRRLVDTEGQEYVDRLFKEKNMLVKESDHYPYLIKLLTEQLRGS